MNKINKLQEYTLQHRKYSQWMDSPGDASGKEPACQCRRRKTHGFKPWVGKIAPGGGHGLENPHG